MHLPWQCYPAGAHVKLFQETLSLWVVKTQGQWACYSPLDDGALFICEKKRSREAAMRAAEQWLETQIQMVIR